MCGGTEGDDAPLLSVKGLSPRVRGNRLVERNGGEVVGSIPACAGEPAGDIVLELPATVYPRVCGGTAVPVAERRSPAGLSPRVRGN